MELSALIILQYLEKAWVTVDAASKVIKTYNYFASCVEELGLQEGVDAKRKPRCADVTRRAKGV
jgi:hypothetical protein